MQTMLQDVRYAARQLRKSPAFTLTAILTLGLGLGAAATMYNVVHDVLLAALPYPAPQQLAGIAFTFPQQKANAEETGANADFIAQHARSFQLVGMAEDGTTGVNLSFLSNTTAPAQVHARHVSAGYLPTLGYAPSLGRTFTAEEDRPGGVPAVVLSYALWQRTFHADSSVIGRSIRLDEEPYTVVGVMPAAFADVSTGEPAELWEPLALSPQAPGYNGDNYQMIGRLRDGVSMQAAQAEIATLTEPFYHEFPEYRRWTNQAKAVHQYKVWPLAQVLTSNVRSSLLTMSAAVLAVLLIACLNLAGLMTMRGSDRARELAIRRALGASQSRLLQALFTEGMLLALGSAVLGLACAAVLTPALAASTAISLPLLHSMHVWQTSLFLLVASLGTSGLFSLFPAWHAVARPSVMALPGKGSTGMDRSRARLGRVLVVAQVALAMVLLSGASLLLGVLLKLQSTSPGFVPQHVAMTQVTLKGHAYEATIHKTQFLDKVLSRIEHAPGIGSVAAIDGPPLHRGLNMPMMPLGRKDMEQTVEFRPVTPGYFHTVNLPLLAGRMFNASDDAHTPAVAVISETAARRWWPGRSPIGERVISGGHDPYQVVVVGVVADTHTDSLAEPSQIMVYAPYRQLPDDLNKMINSWFDTTFVLRTANDAPIAELVQQAISEADPSMPVAKIETMQSAIDDSVAAPRFFTWLSSGFAGFALVLTVLGLFGLLSYQVAQRTRELGLRLALGATRADLLKVVLGSGVVLTLLGLGIGLLVSLAVPRVVGGFLADILYTGAAPISTVLPSSTMALAISSFAVFVAAVLASYLPARRAAAVEPMEALRAE